MKERGVTLLEILLVLVIIATIMILFMSFMMRRSEEARMNKMVITTQQILSAGLSYHHDYGKWTDCTMSDQCLLMTGDGLPLLEKGYLPDQDYFSLWPSSDTDYIQFSSPTEKKFTVCIPIAAGSATQAIAETLASRLPIGRTSQTDHSTPCGEDVPTSTCDDPTQSCRVITSVNVPGRNMKNASSFNFAAVYHNGACVPIPKCPDQMHPDILVYPVSVSGLNEGMNGSGGTSGYVTSLESFTARAIGPDAFDPNDTTGSPGPSDCTTSAKNGCMKDNSGGFLDSGIYWRVCLDVVSSGGVLAGTKWTKQSGSVMVMTRCIPENEPSGSDWDVFRNN